MDEKAVVSRMAYLENKVRDVTQDRNNYSAMVVNFKNFIDKVPRQYPDGEGELTPDEWLTWAKKELGYEVEESQ